MLDLISKFIFRRPTAGKAPVPTAIEIATVQLAEAKKNQVANERAATLEKVANVANDESAAIALLLSCDFADGRLQAAQHVHSAAGLEQVRAAMLNLDKRVVKLMQTRLDAIAQITQQEALAQLCIEEASHLAQQTHLMPNQVIELDKRRAAIALFPTHLKTQFEVVREKIEVKMLAQTALQRQVLDISNQLNALAAIDESASSFEMQLSQLAQLQQELDNCQNQPESVSLPKKMLADCMQKMQEQHQRIQSLVQEKKKADRRMDVKIDQPVSAELDISTQANTEAELADQASSAVAEKVRTPKSVPTLSTNQIIAAIEGMVEALEQGSIQNARKFDKDLRAVDARTAGLTAEQKEQLTQARSELAYLQGWAKWGGDVSRDELINAVLELPTLSLAPNELAKKVAAMRERWRAMEASSGAANKDLWERFDAACKTAYEPAALFFKEQDELRKANLLTAENILIELRSSVNNLLQATPDWKAISIFCMQAQQNWKKLGHVDRKHRARLDADFEVNLQLLRQPLEQRRQEEILSRESLIAQVAALDPQHRSATDQLRALQERWQSQAASVPLRRKDEQALWEKFRAACDHLFAQRKQASGEADAQRKDNLAIKLALCISLEEAIKSTGTNLQQSLQQLLQQTATTWKNTAAVPRAEEAATEQRYQTAVLAVKRHIQTQIEQQREENKTRYLKKVAVCQGLESLLLNDLNNELSRAESTQQAHALISDWQQIGELPSKLNSALQKRFDSARFAVESNDQGYRAVLQKNITDFDAALLQIEITSGIDSPPELSRERLQMQVGVLQTSLKRGTDANTNAELLHRLLTMPVVLDTAKLQRLEKVLLANSSL
ncbi:MAG: DUF349 domain-containing protein [Pseudomonadota bacterium]